MGIYTQFFMFFFQFQDVSARDYVSSILGRTGCILFRKYHCLLAAVLMMAHSRPCSGLHINIDGKIITATSQRPPQSPHMAHTEKIVASYCLCQKPHDGLGNLQERHFGPNTRGAATNIKFGNFQKN